LQRARVIRVARGRQVDVPAGREWTVGGQRRPDTGRANSGTSKIAEQVRCRTNITGLGRGPRELRAAGAPGASGGGRVRVVAVVLVEDDARSGPAVQGRRRHPFAAVGAEISRL